MKIILQGSTIKALQYELQKFFQANMVLSPMCRSYEDGSGQFYFPIIPPSKEIAESTHIEKFIVIPMGELLLFCCLDDKFDISQYGEHKTHDFGEEAQSTAQRELTEEQYQRFQAKQNTSSGMKETLDMIERQHNELTASG